jgi:hypothetical protein
MAQDPHLLARVLALLEHKLCKQLDPPPLESNKVPIETSNEGRVVWNLGAADIAGRGDEKASRFIFFIN